ncbi:MAG: ATP-binding cassette domain-containing protein [Acidimicrobiales bacterium]
MIRFEHVSFTYPGASAPTLRDVDLRIPEGELCLVVGRTGTGKTTFLRAVNGLVPRFTGGHLGGVVSVDGRRTSDAAPREFADLVGIVGQDPVAGFVTDTVEEELAYGMEQLSLPPDVMRTRVEETLDLLGIADLRDRPLRALSGGQQQRVAIGSVLTCHPRVLVLDEPTSALDPTAAEEVLAAITRLVHDLGTTVLLAEHRLERVVQYADRVVQVTEDGRVVDGPPAEMMATSPVAPPVVQLGRRAGWSPLALSVRDARRQAGPLRDALAGATPAGRGHALAPGGAPAMVATDLVVRYDDVLAVRQLSVGLLGGEVVALMGRNGAGKSSLLWALQGSGDRASGTVDVGGRDPADLGVADARRLVGLVPQSSGDLLYHQSVAEECATADAAAGAASGATRALLDRIADRDGAAIDDDAHPRDLSEGQRLALVLAIQLVAAPGVLLLDEPTRGLDYGAKAALAALLAELAAAGRAVVVATHDVEFVASVADRTILMAQGEIVADGATAAVISASPMFAPQVSKILAPQAWLTVEEVSDALDARG